MKTESTRRQMAEEIAAKWDAYANLVDAIEDILKNRDERAVQITEKHRADCLHCRTALTIATALESLTLDQGE